MDSNDMTDDEATALNLKKIVAYVRIKDVPYVRQIAPTSVPAKVSCVDSMAPDAAAIVTTKTDSIAKNNGASRQSAYLARLKATGLTQLNVIIKDIPEIRAAMLELAKRTRDESDWEAVIKNEPFVQAVLHSLESARIRLLRIADLEARHQKAYQAILVHEKISTLTGYRKLLVKLAGF